MNAESAVELCSSWMSRRKRKLPALALWFRDSWVQPAGTCPGPAGHALLSPCRAAERLRWCRQSVAFRLRLPQESLWQPRAVGRKSRWRPLPWLVLPPWPSWTRADRGAFYRPFRVKLRQPIWFHTRWPAGNGMYPVCRWILGRSL